MQATGTRTTKVQITMTVEVPVDEWADNYGCGRGARDVQRDVKSYIREAVQQGVVPLKVVR